jgi:hypothetical protein
MPSRGSGLNAPVRLRSDEPWSPIVPEGWEPVAGVCRAVRDDLPALTERILRAIRREVSSHPARPPAPEQLYADVYDNLDMILFGIAEHREPFPEELAIRGELGRRDATNGLPLQSVMASYHVGFREHWATLVAESQRQGGEAPGKILIASADLWDWTYAMMNVVAAEYGRVIAEREAAEALAHAHFIDLLVRDPGSDACAAIARGLGFDTDGAFTAIAFPASATQGLDARLRASVGERQIVATFGARGRTMLAIVQGAGGADLDAILASATAGEAIGVGLERAGLPGARVSVTDAERALELAETRGSVVRFADAWLPATVLALRGTLGTLLEIGVEVAASNPHLADAVRAFADANFSLAEGARRLVLSQTSLRHRLTRWKTLTGWDPWTLDGMSRSVMSLDLLASRSGTD